jgi:hypothetical protein
LETSNIIEVPAAVGVESFDTVLILEGAKMMVAKWLFKNHLIL